MAANASASEMDCTCPVCCDIFKDPVILLCGHSFCKDCLQEWWRQSKLHACPVCKEIFPMAQPPRNLALRNLSDSWRQERSRRADSGSEEICSLHSEKLKLFCEDDQQLVCVICRDAQKHKKHNCVPINEAAEAHRLQLKIEVMTLKTNLGSFKGEKLSCDKMASHIQLQAQRAEKTIKEEFQKLYQLLRAEEAARIDAVRKEATLKSEAMNIRIVNLTAEISSLSDRIESIEREMKAEDISFMLNVKSTMKRSQCNLPEPETPSGSLIDEAKHLGNLLFTVWMKMKSLIQYTPVTLDPNTGDSLLIMSEHLTRSTKGEKSQPLPDNPERLRGDDVLGFEGFSSGKHSWDVEVGGFWGVGVAARTKNPVDERIWGIYVCTCHVWLHEIASDDVVSEDSFPQKVRVQLDYDQGILSFFDLDRQTLVHTIKHTFTETVFPYFRENAKILPAELSLSDTSSQINSMAANASASEMDCTCPVCCDIFKDPVILLCGHSFCKDCLQEWWRQSELHACPVCKEIFPMAQPPRNLALRNLSDSWRQERSRRADSGSEEICSLHSEKLKLFCEDDQQLVCVICRDAQKHKKHNCVPINEAAEVHRLRLKIEVITLKSKLGSFKGEKLSCDKMASHIQLQAQRAEKTIKEEFQKLYQLLRAEEAARIDAVRKEATLKSEAMNIRIVNLTAEISSLSDRIETIEREMKAEDISFMLNVKSTMKRSQCNLQKPETPSGSLIDEAKHLGNLLFTVWMKMKSLIQYTPVTLDPNTGDSLLIMSEHLTRSTKGEKSQPLPDNPERLRGDDVLGSEGFSSGKHSWDVEVGGFWGVGVAARTNNPVNERIWGLYMCVCSNILRELTPQDSVKVVSKDSFPQKVRVQLDYDQGILSFFDLDRQTLVHTIKHTFTETVFPYFRENAKILPAELSVRKRQPDKHFALQQGARPRLLTWMNQ
ncbi:uncharacterized protein LOC121622411 [Chelmon rostratus]|uniref:uncharacterized protein LOC121622411 n=1 Tax=Chelmon rostratus TaxID=109905 RepID=UPI001BEBDB4A|nr:uncharacterized protein LOC121622411 [Chelmon rostratus]